MENKKIEEHLKRMEMLRRGEKMACPYCNQGKISKINDAVFICDVCGKGIVGRIKIIV